MLSLLKLLTGLMQFLYKSVQFSSSPRRMNEVSAMDVYSLESSSIHFFLIVFLFSLLPQMDQVLQGKPTSPSRRWPKTGASQSATLTCLPAIVSRTVLWSNSEDVYLTRSFREKTLVFDQKLSGIIKHCKSLRRVVQLIIRGRHLAH